ncbi:MAG: hypothetical protein DWQ19_09325 [Crenarchaeota archaeon]|nr:MAG: hypothetical protein DWQ19_09325 [Thermoproteota archaeon]
MKSHEIASGYGVYRQNQIRQTVREVEAQQTEQKPSVFRQETLPRLGILAFLGGWSLMSAMNSIIKKS